MFRYSYIKRVCFYFGCFYSVKKNQDEVSAFIENLANP